jgi:hypothetical protein
MAFANSQNLFEPSATKESLLGDILTIGACAEDRGLFYVTSAGVYAGSYGSSYKPAATDILVTQIADTGPLQLRYVVTNGAISRGKVVEWTGSTAGQVEEGDGNGFAGVALCDIGSGEYAWVAFSGDIVVDYDATATVGVPLALDVAGEVTPTSADKTNMIAVCKEDPGGAGLARALFPARSL